MVTYEEALAAGRRGSVDNEARMAVVIETLAAECGLRDGNIPYAFTPRPVWEAAIAKLFTAAEVHDLLVAHGARGAESILDRD